MKRVVFITSLWVVSAGTHLIASDPARLPGTDKHASSDQVDPALLELECSFCSDPCFNKKKIAVLPCGHIQHARCYAGWLAKGGACPICREPVPAVKTCRRVEEAVPLLQECTFAVQQKLNDTKLQLAEVTAQRNQAHEQARTLMTELERARTQLHESRAQVETLNGRINALEYDRTYMEGTALLALGVVIVAAGFKVIGDAQSTRTSSTRLN